VTCLLMRFGRCLVRQLNHLWPVVCAIHQSKLTPGVVLNKQQCCMFCAEVCALQPKARSA
jgi:hypothetical protein